jgi:hypothetical protein
MIDITKNHKTTTIALIAIAGIAATLLVAGTVAVASNHSAFAWKEKGYKKEKYQRDDNKYQNDGSDSKYLMGSKRGSGSSITLIAANEQSSECETAGGTSPITGSCSNTATATVTNSGGIVGK